VCDELYELIAKRTQQPDCKHKISFCTDGNDQNLNAMLKYFNKDCVHYGQVIKDKEQQIVIGSHVRKVIGNLPYEEIKINNIDGLCSKLRERTACFKRKGRSFAKKRKHISNILHITQAAHNFIEKKYGCTPAMKEGLQSKPFTWSGLIHLRLPYV